MQKFLGTTFVSSILLGLTGAAIAADLPVKAPMVAPVAVSAIRWSGCYVGGNGGVKFGRFHDSASTRAGTATIPGLGTTTFAADTIDLGTIDTSSGVIGGQIGCRWESADHWVIGVEGDLDWNNLHGTVTERTFGTGNATFIPGDSYGNRSRWQSSARLVLGRTWDRWFGYVTGGAAFTRVTMDSNFIATTVAGIPFPASGGSDSKTLAGFTVGAGALYALSQNWEVGAEYRYSQYQGADFGLGPVAAVCGFSTAVAANVPTCVSTDVTGHKDLRTHEFLVKLNYRFDWGGPVVAKY
jgi:outer membrane immunogenic protein